MLRYYEEIRLDNGYVYSCDMIRLNLRFKDNAQKFLDWLSGYNMYGDGIDVKLFRSLNEFTYRNMLRVKADGYSFVIGIGFNGGQDVRDKGFIEFNPNKCRGQKVFEHIYSKLLDYIYSSEVARFDFAIDIPVPRYLCKLKKDGRNYQYVVTQDGETEYLGRRNEAGFVKLYDKTKEAKLGYDLTRLEITASKDALNMPEVVILPYQNKIQANLSSTDKVLVELLKTVDNPTIYLRKLKYEKRKKIEQYLLEDTVHLDYISYSKILKNVLAYQI